MKNNILTGQDPVTGKYLVELWRYEETPSGSTRALLSISSTPIFNTAKEAAQHLWNCLKPEAQEHTNEPDWGKL